MSKKKQELALPNESQVDENTLFERVSEIIENRKFRAGAYANREVTLMYWEIGKYVSSILLGGGRAEYGKRIVSTLSTQLVELYGQMFDIHNIRRMIRFAERFDNFQIVTPLASQLSWSHFIEILPIKSDDALMYYANEAATHRYSAKELRRQISRKAYERQEIANAQLSVTSAVPFNVFKDPYLLDMKWLNKFERQEGENEPIGIILCTKASRNQIELLELDKSGIAVAEYWTNLPSKAVLERKIKEIMHEAKERLERRKALPYGGGQKQIEYFYEAKDDPGD